jgi:hypothetical protein
VRSTAPYFVRLVAPAIARSARSAVLTVTATQPSTLSVRGRRYAVGTRARKVRVPVGAAKAPRLTLTLSAGGRRSQNTIVIRRR